MQNPLISVILPAYNAEKYLAQAINSILNQKCRDFELLVINDGSTDNTEEVIRSFSDSRIRYIKNDNNLGLIGTLNKGISLSAGKYIARMDADDISRDIRFEQQVKYLESNPEVVICSSSRIEFSDLSERQHISFVPLDDISIRISSIFSTPFTHPAVMMRRDIVVDNNISFDLAYKYAEDYDFWIKILMHGKGYNFKVPLLLYRDTPNSQTNIGVERAIERKNTISAIQKKALKAIGLELNQRDLDFMYILSLSNHIKELDFSKYPVKYIKSFFSRLKSDLLMRYPEESKKINMILGKRYLKILAFNIPRLSFKDLISLGSDKFFIYGIRNMINEKWNFK